MGESSYTTDSSRGKSTAPAGEEAIDDALAESFPASDAPPWTLGLDPQSVYLPTHKASFVVVADEAKPSSIVAALAVGD
jgi:hypothetical protein